MNVKRLKELLSRTLETLEDYDDEAEVHMVTNTYFLGNCHTFLGISGYDGGYINLDNPIIEEEDEDDE